MQARDGGAGGSVSVLFQSHHCDHCGDLTWTVEVVGREVHKMSCPHRTENEHQGNCPDLWQKVTQPK